MTGSLQVKNEKFYMVLNLYENGKRKTKWIATGLDVKGNKRKAEQMLREKLQTYEPQKPSADMLFADCVRQWLTTVARKVDAITYQGYEVLVNLHILPYFDENRLQLKQMTVDVLQLYFDEKATRGRADGKGGLSPKSLRNLRNVINQPLREAVKNGLLSSNPCEFVVLPRKERYQSKFYTESQMHALFDAIQGDELEPLIRIAALYGLRRSEVLGLQWDSIDFESGLLTIKHTVAKVTKTVAKDSTKSASSRRSFPLTPEARAIFENAKQAEAENRKAFGKEYKHTPYVFKWANGEPYSPDYVSKHFRLLLKKHNLPHIRFHEIRHSCASMLMNNGCTLKDVQEWMGHADIQTTSNIYGHLDAARKQGMADVLRGGLFGKC